MAWIVDWATEKAAGAAHAGLQMGGNFAGNAVGSIGSMIESAGRGVGESVSGAIGGVGGRVNSYGEGIKNSTAPSTPARVEQKAAVKKPETSVKRATPAAQRTLADSKSVESSSPVKKTPSVQKVKRSATPTAKLTSVATAAKPLKPSSPSNTTLSKTGVPAAAMMKTAAHPQVKGPQTPPVLNKKVGNLAPQNSTPHVVRKAEPTSAKSSVGKTVATAKKQGTIKADGASKITAMTRSAASMKS